jgi:antagonist of KipI
VKVLAPGLLTTVQDLGRMGFAQQGVSPSGAMDGNALRAANLLVGNDEDAAGLEITSGGVRLEFRKRALIAICGADLSPAMSGVALSSWRAIYAQDGSVVEFGYARRGWRAYFAVAGGIDVPKVMGSRSTYLRAGVGGLEGRPLRTGDLLARGRPSAAAERAMFDSRQSLGPLPFALTDRVLVEPERLYRSGPIRFVPGPDWHMMDEADRKAFVTESFEISTKSDRMGYRLSGRELRSAKGAELISTAVLTGTVQVPPGGEPIVLLADRQTTGGYPMVAQVTRADLGAVAQLRPGNEIRFAEVTIDDAHQALRHVEKVIDELKGAEHRAPSRP